MASLGSEGIGRLDPAALAERLRSLAGARSGVGIVDEMELRHLVSVILHGSLLLHDLYSSRRIESIYSDPRLVAHNLINPLLEERDDPDAELLARVGRMPDEIRLVGDKCLFDVGITRIESFRGLDLHDLGCRAYRMASEILRILGEDSHLREFFRRNSLAPLPISEEVTFLRQCAERFGVHADLLMHLQIGDPIATDDASGILVPRGLTDIATGSGAPASGLAPPKPPPAAGIAHGAAAGIERSASPGSASGSTPGGAAGAGASAWSDLEALSLSREDLLSSYERIVLFAALDVDRLRTRLNEVVVDQLEAVEAICDEFALYAAGTHSLTKPPSYFFVGPTGVGKNHLVETLVRFLGELSSVDIPLLTIDGPNYTDASDINELRGSTRGFIRSDEEGLLAEFHERSSRAPLSVILVDEVEKAHPHLRKFFLSLMDRGSVTDNRGRALVFANSMLVFTSNLGFSESSARGTPIGYRGEESRDLFEESEVSRSLRQALSAEFVNRLRIIRFEHLSRGSIEKIFDLEFNKVRRRFREVHGIDLVVTAQGREELLARGYSHEFGARHLASVINRVANVEVSKRLKRDDAGGEKMEHEVLEYLRQIRRNERAFDPREVRARVLEAARVQVPYRALTISFEDGRFTYRP